MRQPDEPEDLGSEYDHWRNPPRARWHPLWLSLFAGVALTLAAIFFIYGTANCIALLEGMLP